jgi:hypothetical protein
LVAGGSGAWLLNFWFEDDMAAVIPIFDGKAVLEGAASDEDLGLKRGC